QLGGIPGGPGVVISEHEYAFTPLKWDEYINACRQASSRKCAVVPGIEYSSCDGEMHVVTMGTPKFPEAHRDLVDIITAVRAEGGAAVLAHPRRRDCFDKITTDVLAVLDGVEIWNRKVDGLLPAKLCFKFARSHALATTVGMDLHAWRQI